MDRIDTPANVRLKEISDEFRVFNDQKIVGEELARLGVKLLGKAEDFGAFRGSQYAPVRLALNRWRGLGDKPWDEVVGQKSESDASIITWQTIVQTLFPDLADMDGDTGKCELHLWVQWTSACLRIADLLDAEAAKMEQDERAGGNGGTSPTPNYPEKWGKWARSKLWLAIPIGILSVLLYWIVPFVQMVKNLRDWFGNK